MQVKQILTPLIGKSKNLSIQFLKHSSHYYNMPVFEIIFPVRLTKTYVNLIDSLTKCEDYLNHYVQHHYLKQGVVRVQVLTRIIKDVI
jgi:hypothetical protein